MTTKTPTKEIRRKAAAGLASWMREKGYTVETTRAGNLKVSLPDRPITVEEIERRCFIKRNHLRGRNGIVYLLV